MKKILLKWFMLTLGIYAASYLLQGFEVTSPWTMIIGAAILGLLNVTLKPLLIIITLPINILTLGLFTLVINGIILLLAGSILRGWYIYSFWTAVGAAVIISIVSLILNALFTED